MEQQLVEGGVFNLTVKEGTMAVAHSGAYWLTRRGDPEDYFLVPGEAMVLPRGRWLVQALGAGTLSWTDNVPVPQKIVFRRSEVEACHLSAVSGV